MLAGEFDEHTGLTFLLGVNPGLRQMPLGAIGPPMRWLVELASLIENQQRQSLHPPAPAIYSLGGRAQLNRLDKFVGS